MFMLEAKNQLHFSLNIITSLHIAGAKVAMTMANHPAKNTSNVKRVKSVRKRSRMVMRSKIRISDQDEVSLKMNEKDMFKHVACLIHYSTK